MRDLVHNNLKMVVLAIFAYTMFAGVVGFIWPDLLVTFTGENTGADSPFFIRFGSGAIFFFSFIFLIAANDPENNKSLFLLGFAEKSLFTVYFLVALTRAELGVLFIPAILLDGVAALMLGIYLFVPAPGIPESSIGSESASTSSGPAPDND